MAKKLAFYLITLVFVLVVLEVFAWVTSLVVDRDDLFDHRAGVLARLNSADLAAFVKKGGDPVLGWETRGPAVRQEANCRGSLKTYTYNETGARTYAAFSPENSQIVIVGDSYTNGDEVNDEEAYPAQLADILGVSVANQGVGGYGPTQAFLDLKKKLALYPQARITILAIMYENLYRMVNSYRPVLYNTSSNYTLKPFMADGEIRPHPGEAAFADLASFKHFANEAFDTDYWAKPKAAFPYTIAIVKALGSNYFYLRKLQKQLRNLGLPEYALAFESKEIRLNLIGLLNKYTDFVVAQGLQPVVIFIPRNRYDTRSASRFIEQNGAQLHKALFVGDVAQATDIDWEQFNLQEEKGDDICHPSVYGYRKIAAYMADFLIAKGLQPVRGGVRAAARNSQAAPK